MDIFQNFKRNNEENLEDPVVVQARLWTRNDKGGEFTAYSILRFGIENIFVTGSTRK